MPEQTTVPPVAAPTPLQAPVTQLRSSSALLRDAWKIYNERIGVLIGALVLPQVGAALLIAIAAGVALLTATFGVDREFSLATLRGYPAWVLGAGAVGLILMAIFMAWSQASLMSAVVGGDERIGVRESCRRGWSNLLPFIWLSALSVAILFGGFFLFVIPAIIFLAWFTSAQFILFKEGHRGMQALMVSKEYVRGRWGAVFGRVSYMTLVLMIASIVLSILLAIVRAPDFVHSLLSALILTPLSMVYYYELYRDLALTRGAPVTVSTNRIGFILVAIFGVLVIPALVIGYAYALSSLDTAREKVGTAYLGSQLSMLRVELELYHSENESYPVSLELLEEGVPEDSPATFTYTPEAGGAEYRLCAVAPGQAERCIDSGARAGE